MMIFFVGHFLSSLFYNLMFVVMGSVV